MARGMGSPRELATRVPPETPHPRGHHIGRARNGGGRITNAIRDAPSSRQHHRSAAPAPTSRATTPGNHQGIGDRAVTEKLQRRGDRQRHVTSSPLVTPPRRQSEVTCNTARPRKPRGAQQPRMEQPHDQERGEEIDPRGGDRRRDQYRGHDLGGPLIQPATTTRLIAVDQRCQPAPSSPYQILARGPALTVPHHYRDNPRSQARATGDLRGPRCSDRHSAARARQPRDQASPSRWSRGTVKPPTRSTTPRPERG